MELKELLAGDIALTHFFNHCLAQPIFPVHLHFSMRKHGYSALSLSGIDGALDNHMDPEAYSALLDWTKLNCWSSFLKSQLYCRYRLYCALHGAALSPGCISLSSRKDRDDDVLLYDAAISLEVVLKETLGAALVEVWLACEGHVIGVRQHWTAASSIFAHCHAVPYLLEIPKNRPGWMQQVQACVLQRLKSYWLPRVSHIMQLPSLVVQSSGQCSEYCSGQSSEGLGQSSESSGQCGEAEILKGLVCNLTAGDPFSYYLSRQKLGIRCYLLWKECHYLTVKTYSEQKLLQEGWRVWTTFLDPCGDLAVWVHPNLSEQMHRALQCKAIKCIKYAMDAIKIEMLSLLKRLWSRFQRHLYKTFSSCFKCLLADGVDMEDESILASNKVNAIKYGTQKKKRLDPKIIVDSDIKGGALEALGDLHTLLQFEQFLYTSKGAFSEENTCYKLWKAITQFQKMSPWQHDSLVIHIHKTFFSIDSKFHLPEELDGFLDQGLGDFSNTDKLHPKSTTFVKFKKILEKLLGPSIKEFLHKVGKLPDEHHHRVNKKTKVTTQLQEDSVLLLNMLTAYEGPLIHKLKHFSEYIIRHSHSSIGQIHANGVQFWWEIQKFKVLYEGGAGIHTLYHKIEAIVDCYLDTSTLPWVKVAVFPELVTQIVSALGDLYQAKVNAHVDRLMDLFERSRQAVFREMVPYWGDFCKVYQSPIEAVPSFPQVVCCSPVVSRVGSVQVPIPQCVPPLPPMQLNAAPLLSYSLLKGITWKLPFSS